MKKRVLKSVVAILICLAMVFDAQVLTAMAGALNDPEVAARVEVGVIEGNPTEVDPAEETLALEENVPKESVVDFSEEYEEAELSDSMPKDSVGYKLPGEEELLEDEELESEQYDGSYTPDGASYSLTYEESGDGTIKIKGWKGIPEGNLVIPRKIEGKYVTWIGSNAFAGCSGFTGNLTIPYGVTMIGYYAFGGCSGFTGSLTIPDSVISIMDDAFEDCSGFYRVVNRSNKKCTLPILEGLTWKDTTGQEITSITNGIAIRSDVSTYETYPNANYKLKYDELDDGTIRIIGWEGTPEGNLVIPNKIESKDVTMIEDYAFAGCDGFTGSLTIGDSVTTIGDYAFFECTGFTGNLIIPNSVTTIGDYAFASCSGFTGGLTIPNSVETIGDLAFDSCSGFNGSLTIGDSVTTIGGEAFAFCNFSGNLTIPDSVTTIGDYAFYVCRNFTGSLTIPDSVTTIGDSTFGYCPGFSGNLVIPDSVTTIGDEAFAGCSGFTGNLTIPDSITTIGDEAFAWCSGFTGNLTIPDSVTTIEDYAFYGCSGFRIVVNYSDQECILPSSIGLTWKDAAGREIISITNGLAIRSDVSTYEPYPNSSYKLAYDELDDGTIRIIGCEGTPEGNLVIPSKIDGKDVTTIGDYAFDGCDGFTGSLTIPDSVMKIGISSFSGCRFTGKLMIPIGVTNIEKYAFNACNGFTGSLIIPHTVTTLGTNVFMNCSGFNKVVNNSNLECTLPILEGLTWKDTTGQEITSITNGIAIRSDVSTYEPYPNANYKLKYDELDDGTIRIIGWEGTPEGNLVIPNKIEDKDVTMIEDYAFACCDGFTGNLTIGDSVTRIGMYAFSECTGFTGNLIIPNSVTTIGEVAFNSCNGFTGNLTIGDSVKTIGNEAFGGCYGFTGSLTIPNSVETIGDFAFDGCGGFDGNLKIGNSVETIGEGAFFTCSGFIGSLTIPDSVKTIGDNAFVCCSGFTGNLIIPNSVTTIAPGSFSGCNMLTGDLAIPDSVTTIGAQAFDGCNGFNGRLTIGDSVKTIGMYAFSNCNGFTGSLRIPDSVTTIGESTFYGCEGFTGSLIIPERVEIGPYAFGDCSGFRKVVNNSNQEYTLLSPDGQRWTNAKTGAVITKIANGTAIRSDYYDPVDAPCFTHDPVGEQIYTGKPIKPAVRVYFGETELEEKKDYTIVYANNTNAGLATFTVTGKGNYAEKDSDSFVILKKDINGSGVSFTVPSVAKYTKKEQTPVPKITYNGMTLKKGKDFELTYFSDQYCTEWCIPKEPGKYYINITGIGNYEGGKEIPFVIVNPNKKLMSTLKGDKIKDQPYNNGNPITLDETKLVIRDGGNALKKGVDYVVDDDADYSGNVYPGTAKVTVHGVEEKGYVGTLTLTFKITGTPINKVAITAPDDCVYNGTEQRPEPTVAGLMKDRDYELTYEKNINAGKAKVTVKGKGGYTGSVSKTFTIKPAALTEEMISLDRDDPYEYPYTGSGVKPVTTVTFGGTALNEGRDYTVKYTNNSAITTAATTKRPTVSITGKGNFAGKTDKFFKIVPANLGDCQVTANVVIYAEKEGNWKTKKITILGVDGKALKAGKDYDDRSIRYTSDAGGNHPIADNATLGAGDVVYVTVQSKGTTYTGTAKGSYTIATQDISKMTASLDPKTYTGKAVKLAPSDIGWKLGGNAVDDVTFDFIESSYTNNVNKGKATVVVRGTGNYGGTKTITFTIGTKGILWWWRNLFN